MLQSRFTTLAACCSFLLAAAGAVPAWAGDHHKCCKLDVDIDDLDADLYPDGDGWLLKVRYEVDVEHACGGDHLVLNLQFSDDDCRIADGNGRNLTQVVALDRPSKCDGDEQTFIGCAEIRLAGNAIADPKDVDVHATVTRAGDSCTLDSENTSADAHLPCVVVECAPRVVEVRHVEPVIVVRRPVVYVRPACYPGVVTVRRPYYAHVGVRW